MFQFSSFASVTYVFQSDTPCGVGSPIQISADQKLVASSPQLFAGCRVFLRL